MKHADMHPATKARVDAGAMLGRKLAEYASTIRLLERNHCTQAYVDIKRAEYDSALNLLIAAALAEGASLAESEPTS